MRISTFVLSVLLTASCVHNFHLDKRVKETLPPLPKNENKTILLQRKELLPDDSASITNLADDNNWNHSADLFPEPEVAQILTKKKKK